MCSSARRDAVQRITDLLRDRDEETVRVVERTVEALLAGPGRTADNVTDGARPDWPGAVFTVAGSKRPRQRRGLLSCFFCLGPLRPLPAAAGTARRDLAAGAAGSAVPAGSSASCGALWAGRARRSRRLRRRGCAAFRAWTPPCFPARGRGRRLLDRRRGEQGLQMLIGQLTLHGAVLPGQGGGQLTPECLPRSRNAAWRQS